MSLFSRSVSMVMPCSTAAGTSSNVPRHQSSSVTSHTASARPKASPNRRAISESVLASNMGSMHFSEMRTFFSWLRGMTSSNSYMSVTGSRISA